MGTGDWNDGMDRVGREGKGESVWLAFFLYDVLSRFEEIARRHKDPDFATQCEIHAKTLKENIEKNGWDGNWYRRAYFDDGTPLGSASDAECQIDSIPQSWATLSVAGDEQRRGAALQSAYDRLVQKDKALVLLLSPAFDKSALDPGYIKGYVPGVRENGGQYTHAAVWLAMAFAKSGDNNRAWELFNLISPINHGRTAKEIATYKVEPYVTAGDVYAVAPHTGQGGWTWYTGSAGWMYQLIISSVLGIKKTAGKISFDPCIPDEWSSFKIHYRFGKAVYHITISRKEGTHEMSVILDGAKQEAKCLTLVDDGKEHFVEVSSTDILIEQ
jgi:cellobiose phosphorylase